MDTHFFKKLSGKYKIPYRNYYTSQNLLAVRAGALIFLLLNVVIRLLYMIFPASLTRAENFPEFDITNWAFIGFTIFFYLMSHLLVQENRKTKKASAIMALFVFIFSLYIICCGMFSSFIATGDPRNALVLYLIALSVISMLCVFEAYETIILIIAAEFLFTSLLIHANTDPTDMLYNQLMSVILLTGFYLISRYYFSYKANYYLQLIEIQEKNLTIERGSEFKSQLLGIVAHDLRNPIAAVESVAMLMEMDAIDDDTKDNLYLVKASCVKARTIIDELLEAARNENATAFVTVKTELNKMINEIIFMWKIERDTTNNIVLISNMSQSYANLNVEKFNRVLDNLIGNALKFSPENSKVEVHLYKSGSEIVIEVKDHGLGIPAKMLPILFDPFSKAGRQGLKGEQSTGLGPEHCKTDSRKA